MSDSTALSVPAAGWYPDRSDPRVSRWWDGQQWTDHIREAASAVAASVLQPVSASAFGLTPVAAAPVAVVASAASSTIVAGWYVDNADARLQRWWDGAHWTAHTAPRAGLLPQTPAAVATAAYEPNPTYAYGAPGVKPAANAIATRGMIFSLIGILINPLLAMSIVGIVMGFIGLSRASSFTPQYARRGRAVAAIAVGIGWSVISVAAAVYVYNVRRAGL